MEQLNTLKDILLTLKPAGADGFEGLLRVVLTELTGIPFRLASSGLQGGIDGDSAFRNDAICFEAKRYSEKIHRNEVITKIADLARTNTSPDRLWILGATTEIGTQLEMALRVDGEKNAISTLILDWVETPLPLLAVAITAAHKSAKSFLIEYCELQPAPTKLDDIFQKIKCHPDFSPLLNKLKSDLNTPVLALTHAERDNKAWRETTFSSASIARNCLGQPLTVNHQTEFSELREELRQQIRQGLKRNKAVALLGGEGHGKSWLAAQICLEHQGLALFASAEQFESLRPLDLDDLLIDLLIEQSGGTSDDPAKKRWKHRLNAWSNQPTDNPVLFVLDGINQRQNLHWARLIDSLNERLIKIGGQLIITVRPQFWGKVVSPGLNFSPQQISVPEWTPEERDALLQHYGIKQHWLDKATLNTLKNPRLLGIAVTTLPQNDHSAWKGLTPDRILFEHLRASQRERFEDENLIDLVERLSDHAKQVLEKVKQAPLQISRQFQQDSNNVIETRFFQTCGPRGKYYELRDEGLALALGYALIDNLWQAQQYEYDLDELIEQLIDPISSMDRAADVIFSSLMISALDSDPLNTSIFSVLLKAFSNLQNLDSQRFDEFVEIVKKQPVELLNTLKLITLGSERHLNQDWLTEAAYQIAQSEEGWLVIEPIIHRWLRSYNKDFVEQVRRFPRVNTSEDMKHLNNRKQKIQAVLSSLSPFEKNLLDEMNEASGNVGALLAQALKLLASKPLADFADSFIALGLSFTLDEGVSFAREAFSQLTSFNRMDRELTKQAFLKAIKPLRSEDTSTAGQWTIVRMLYATGDFAAALEAKEITQKLRTFEWQYPEPNSWKLAQAADPNIVAPIDFDSGIKLFLNLSTNNIMQTMSQSSEAIDYNCFLPIACRFDSDIAKLKARELLSGLLTRTGIPLRQLILNGTSSIPLMTREMSTELMERATSTNMMDDISQDDEFLKMFLLWYIVPHLSTSEQLKCLTNPIFGPTYLLNIIPCLKLENEGITDFIQNKLDLKDERAAYGVLTAILFGNVSITQEFESLAQYYCNAQDSKLRAHVFEISIKHELRTIRYKHTQGSWKACDEQAGTYENWFGSVLLIKACTKGELSVEQMIKRISQEAWFYAAEQVGEELVQQLAHYFLLCIQKTAGITISREQEDLSGVFFVEGQNVSPSNLFDSTSRGKLKLLINSFPAVLLQILEILEDINPNRISALKNISFVVANLISKDWPERAVALFQKALASEGVMNYSIEMIWSSAPSEAMKSIWEQRLLQSENNEALAKEVLAAERFDAKAFLKEFADKLANSSSTLDQAYAATIMGFSSYPEQFENIDIIQKHIEEQNIVGDAARIAKKSYDQYQWSQKWANDMWSANSAEEFWRCLIILQTCIDARTPVNPTTESQWQHFVPLFEQLRKKAIKEKNKERKEKLLGEKTPDSIFLTAGYA
ncbi:hypothetical protein [Oceanospirillum beijerinckii]|uniref:hypothetical protein n=1 Tax=Oceanospirillum beijerinckii TaxID=64976 RepID=UPI0004033700|nr:hypothetical protein [Oceanospirillum beijerinckii]